jgi:hypothetical protein
MPIAAKDLTHETFLRLLLLGRPKVGKSTSAIATSPGPRRVLLCEDMSAVRGAKRLTLDFDVEPIGSWNSMTAAVVEAKQDAKAGKIKTVVIDPLSDFADRLLAECFKATLTNDGKEDGRRAYPMLSNRLGHLIELIFTIPAHVIVICHYVETGGDPIDGGLEKTGEGIVPLLPGKSRALIAAKFSDVIWMDLAPMTTPTFQKGERIFVTGPRGAWGPGCRSLEGSQVLKADIGELLKAFAAQAKTDANPHQSNHRPAAKPLPPKPIIRKTATT